VTVAMGGVAARPEADPVSVVCAGMGGPELLACAAPPARPTNNAVHPMKFRM